MTNEKKVLGHIDCPSCGTVGGMRITLDKNGDPFGFCEANCDQQLRIGGNARRVRAFLERFPWASGETVPVPVPEAKPAPAEKIPVTVTEKKPDEKPRKTVLRPANVGFDMGL